MNLLKYENVNWNVPLLFYNFPEILENFIEICEYIDKIPPFKYAYGAPECKWNGEENSKIKNSYDIGLPECVMKRVIVPIVTFSAYNLNDIDLSDKNSNRLLDEVIHVNGEIEVSSDILYNHIKKRYPNAKINAAALKSVYELEPNKEVDFYKRLLDKFDRVVLSPQYVKDKFLQDIEKYDDLSRFEIIVNEGCIRNCSVIKEHMACIEQKINFDNCPMYNMNLKDLYLNSLALDEQDIETILKNTNIRTFRVKGRNLQKESLKFSIVDYVFKKYGTMTYLVHVLSR